MVITMLIRPITHSPRPYCTRVLDQGSKVTKRASGVAAVPKRHMAYVTLDPTIDDQLHFQLCISVADPKTSIKGGHRPISDRIRSHRVVKIQDAHEVST